MSDISQTTSNNERRYGKAAYQYVPSVPVPSTSDVEGAQYLKPKALGREITHMLTEGAISGVEVKVIRNMQGICMQVGIGDGAFYFKRSALEPFAFIPRGSKTAYICNTLTGDEQRQKANAPIANQIKSGFENLEYKVEFLS